VEFRILGPLEVDRNGESLPLGGAKQRGLLAILLLNANEVVSTDRLIDELWGEEAPDTAAKALQVHVSQLRKVLEPDRKPGESGRILVTRQPGYLIQLESGQLDLSHFEHLAAEGRRALAAGDPGLATRTLREALALWRGAPLADLAYADFVQREAPRLEGLRLTVLEDRIQADLDSGRHAEIIGELERVVAKEPLRERPRAQLMLALYRAGRQAEALDAYREARQVLVDELGIEPGRELKELEAAVLAQDPSLAAPVRREPAPEARTTEGQDASALTVDRARAGEQFVGREAELRDLEVALEAALLGRGSAFLVGGEPGIGKSRLVDELSERARALDTNVLWGRCWEAGGAPAYWPWVQALRAHVRAFDRNRVGVELAGQAPEIVHLLPELRELLPDLPQLDSPDSESARFRLFDATASFVRRATERRPLVIALEDLHAADTPSLLLLQFMAGEIASSRLLIIGTFRDIELGPRHPLSSVLVELGRQPATRILLLRGFGETDVATLIESIAGISPSRRVAAAIQTGTGGNPLFVGELVRLLLAEGRLEEPIDESGVRLAIPRGVREVIARRLDRVSGDSRETLAVASVLGREFAVEALAHVGKRSPEEVLGLLDEAIGEGIVAEVPGAAYRMRFSHVLLRDALYEELGPSRRTQLHRQIGDTLEDRYADDPDPHLAELAHHYWEAGPSGDPRKAYDYARRAGERATRLLGHEEAARLFELALRVIEAGAPVEELERCETLLALGEAQLRAGEADPARATFLAAAELARTSTAPEALARAALGYGGRYTWMAARGDPQMIPLLEEALSGLPAGDSVLRAKLMARLSCALRDQPFRERRLGLSEEALEMARRLGDPRTLSYALDARCISIDGPDTYEEFGATCAEVVRLARATGEIERELQGHIYRHLFELETGNIAAAREELAAAERLAEETREPAYRWYPAGTRATLALFEGRFDDAVELIANAYELGWKAQGFNPAVSYRLQMLMLHLERGQPPYQESALRELAARYPTYTILHCGLARFLVGEERAHEASALVDELAEDDFARLPVDEEYLAAFTLLTDACAALGRTDHARSLYGKLIPFADLIAAGYPETILGSVERPLGVLAAMDGEWEAAEGHFARAVEVNSAMGSRPWVAHAQHDFARALIEKGNPEDGGRAPELLASALDAYRDLAMKPWQERAEADQQRIEGAHGGR
jgi:DNA-binding SARP family transcriptional activator